MSAVGPWADWERQQPAVDGERKFDRMIRLKHEWEALVQQQENPPLDEYWKQFIPDVDPDERAPLSDYHQLMDEAIKSLSFEEVFEKCQQAGLIKKSEKPVHTWSGDSNKFSCPNPAHPDEKPSAWGSREKGKWNCGGCDAGGDKFHLLGYLYGLSTKGNDFHQLCKRAAADFRGVTEPTPEPPATMPTPPVVVVVAEPTAPVGPSVPDDESNDDDAEITFPEYNLEEVLPDTNSFLDFYCEEALKADIPREFPLWVGLSILSVALGRNVTINRIGEPTYANLSVCLTANSAAGKGRSTMQGLNVLKAAIPYDETPLAAGFCPEGVRVVRLPGSGEALVHELDVTFGTPVMKHFAPPALVEFEEIQMLLSKSGPTSSFKDYIIQFSDTRSYISSSSLKNGKGTVLDGFVSFLTATQPLRLRDQFTQGDKGRGLVNRFIFPFGKVVPSPAWDQPEMNWTLAEMSLRGISKWALDGRHFSNKDWDDDAREYWISQHDKVELDTKGPRSDLLGRMKQTTIKLILLFVANEMSDRVTLGHVKSAFALYDYIKNCNLTLAREIAATEMSDGMKAVLDAIEKAEEKLKKPPTIRELARISTDVADIARNAEQLNNVLIKLLQARQIFHVETKSKTGKGRTGNCYTTNIAQWSTHGTLTVSAAQKP